MHNKIVEAAEAQGLSVNDFLTANAHYQKELDDVMREYLFEGLIQRRLLRAATSNPVVATRR